VKGTKEKVTEKKGASIDKPASIGRKANVGRCSRDRLGKKPSKREGKSKNLVGEVIFLKHRDRGGD